MQDVIDDFDSLYQLSVNVFEQARCDASHDQHVFGLVLYGNLLESMAGAVSMLRAGNHSPLRGLGRSIMEAYVEVQNLCAHCDYTAGEPYEYLEQMHAGELVVTLAAVEAFLEKHPGHLQMEKSRKELEQLVRDNKAQRQYRLSAKKRFALAGVPESWYYDLYLNTCGFSHTKLSDLLNALRYTDDICTVKLFQPWPKEYLLPLIQAMCYAAMAGLGALHNVRVPGIDYGDVLNHFRTMLKYWAPEEASPVNAEELAPAQD